MSSGLCQAAPPLAECEAYETASNMRRIAAKKEAMAERHANMLKDMMRERESLDRETDDAVKAIAEQ